MGRHARYATALALVAVLGVLPADATSAPPHPGPVTSTQMPAIDEVVLTGDVTVEVRRLASVVVAAAEHQGVPLATGVLEVRFVDRIDADGFVAGRTDGRRILIGCNVAQPELTLLHELAHAVVGPEYGHDDPWRSVYLAAVGEVFGERTAQREQRRIEWVYDKSYLEG